MDKEREDDIDLAQLTDYLGYQLRQAQTASFRDLSEPFRELDVTPGEFSLMTIVKLNSDIRQTDLLRIYRLDKSTMSVAVKRLVGRGLVTQDQLPGDRRFRGLSLTVAGREVLAAATALVEAQERRMEDALGDIDRDVMMEALRRIVGVLRRD